MEGMQRNSKRYKLSEMIMSSEYFNGISQLFVDKSKSIVTYFIYFTSIS